MSWLFDSAAVVLLVVNVYLGFRLGLFGRMFAFAGLYGGIGAATFCAVAIDRFFTGGGGARDLYTSAWTYLIVVAVVVTMLEILGFLYRDKILAISTLAYDRAVGALAGVVVAGFQVGLIAMVWLAVGDAPTSGGHPVPVDRARVAAAVHDSVITGHVSRLQPAMKTVFGPVLPGDLSARLADATAK